VLARLSKLLWVVLLACAFVVLDTDRAEAREVLTSWYGLDFQGEPTASGEPYNAYGYTAAHKKLPFGTDLLVSYGGRSVRVTVNDRGPYIGGRKLDLSMGAAKYLGLKRVGVDYVKYRRVGGGDDTATTMAQAAAMAQIALPTLGGGISRPTRAVGAIRRSPRGRLALVAELTWCSGETRSPSSRCSGGPLSRIWRRPTA
jgi:rare lipoprotein A